MSVDFQPFLISEFKTGLYDYLKPWIRPADAFEPLVNSYVYRGILQKRNGSTIFGNQLTDQQPVMGIMQYQNESTTAVALVVASTQYLYLYTPGGSPDGGTFAKVSTVVNSPFWGGTATGTLAVNVLWNHITASSVTIKVYIAGVLTTTTTDDGTGGINAAGIIAAGSTINYTTGAVSINFTGTTLNVVLQISCTLSGVNPIFTGNITNFFNWTNWQPTASETSISTSYLYMTNNVDPVTLFDGTAMSRPGFYVDAAGTPTNRISKALDVKVYNNRLLLLRPTIVSETNPSNQAIYFSALFSPFDFIGDVAGHGGFTAAATGDQIISAEFLRDVLIVNFSNTSWTFQPTGVAANPFLFRRLNNTKTTKCPYAGVAYDQRVTNLGSTGFIACDGVNTDRYDLPIIEYYESEINQKYFNQDFAQRYDNLNQSWMFYPSSDVPDTDFPLVGSVAPGSDETLVYNFLENTWATYKNSFPMTCMGLFNVTSGTTWAELNVTPQDKWENTQSPWFSYSTSATAPMLLGGDTSGNIYHLDNSIAVRDGESSGAGGTSFQVEIKTTRWNPFMQTGQKTQFGYIDVYYSVSSVDPLNPIGVTLNFYVDNSTIVAASRPLTLDGPDATSYTFKRIYCNLTGEFIQIEIDPDEDAPFEILGFVLWARPAGRLTP